MSHKRPQPLADRFAGTEWLPPPRDDEEQALCLFPPEVVIRALGQVLGPERAARLDAVASARLSGVVVVLEDLYDPHNGGAALRSCESMGLLEVHVIEGKERFRVSRKVTQGCDKWLEITRHKDPEACLSLLRRRGFRLYAAVPGAATTLEALDPVQPAAFLVGNEHDGLSRAARAACDTEFAIPLHGFSQSVNLSVATALTVYVHTSRRRQALQCPTDLSGPRLAELRARYYARDVRGAAEIVRHFVAATQDAKEGRGA
jgi:tRNA (guanosine-2'-O-)-methyltransferase